jgi:aminoglycoside 3-N-acetyltransferase I
MHVVRLNTSDRDLARRAFSMMADVFEEDSDHLSDDYLDRLLKRDDFWGIVALEDGEVVGGLTAHTLPMTISETPEIFIYDVAVRSDRQRQGVGRRLMTALRERALAVGAGTIVVPADEEDAGAIEFYRSMGGAASPVVFFTFPKPGD